MIVRRLEPEVMDSPEEARVYDAMDHSEVNDRFVADFLACHGSCRGGPILDVGTGTALIPIRLAQADPAARIVAIDLAEHMLALGRQNVDGAGLADRIALRLLDAKGMTELDEPFEAVISNSIVHHIPEPRSVLEAMVRRVAPGGTLFVRDLARPDDLDTLNHLVETYVGNEPEHARMLFADSLHAALTVEEICQLLEDLGIPDAKVAMTSDRHWTCTWTRP